MSQKTTKIPETACNACSKVLCASTSFNEKIPNSGDVSICIGCGNIAHYNDDLNIVELTEEELQKLKNDKESWAEISKYIASINMLHGHEG